MKNRFKGFTLAETLVTLGIIGVVAAMTIPNLVQNYQKKQYVTQLKKAYNQLSQAARLLASDYGCVDDLTCTGLFVAGNEGNATDAFMKNFKVIKKTSPGQTADFFASSYKTHEGGSAEQGDINQPICDASQARQSNYSGSLLLADGTAINVISTGSGAVGPNSIVMSIQIDINAQKGPNMTGRDFFNFAVLANTKVLPAGSTAINPISDWKSSNIYNCTTPLQGDGVETSYGCAARIMEEGWEMNY